MSDRDNLVKSGKAVSEAQENVLLGYLFGSCIAGYVHSHPRC